MYVGMTLECSNGKYAVKFGNQKINFYSGKGEFVPFAAAPTEGSADICLIAEGKIGDIKNEILAKGCPIGVGSCQRRGATGIINSVYIRDPDKNLIEISTYEK